MKKTTKERLLDAGLELLLRHGYNDLGIQFLLETTGVPKGSFYHHFKGKEDFALQVVDSYMVEVHEGLDHCLGDTSLPPLDRVRKFFELTREKYRSEGYLGCLLGGLGQELSGVNVTFQKKIEWCLSEIATRIAGCLEEARQSGELPADADPHLTADLVLDFWEGAALRSRLKRDPSPLDTMLDFCFSAVITGGTSAPVTISQTK